MNFSYQDILIAPPYEFIKNDILKNKKKEGTKRKKYD